MMAEMTSRLRNSEPKDFSPTLTIFEPTGF
jgi:hypothetical protein